MAINGYGRGVLVIIYACIVVVRVGPSNEAVTGRGDGTMDGVDEGKGGGGAAAAAAPMCAATLVFPLQQLLLSVIVCRMVKMVPGNLVLLYLVEQQVSNIWSTHIF